MKKPIVSTMGLESPRQSHSTDTARRSKRYPAPW